MDANLVGTVLPVLGKRIAMALTIFVPTIGNTADPAPASVVSAIPPAMAWKVSRQVSSVFRKPSFQTRRADSNGV